MMFPFSFLILIICVLFYWSIWLRASQFYYLVQRNHFSFVGFLSYSWFFFISFCAYLYCFIPSAFCVYDLLSFLRRKLKSLVFRLFSSTIYISGYILSSKHCLSWTPWIVACYILSFSIKHFLNAILSLTHGWFRSDMFYLQLVEDYLVVFLD